MVNKLEIAKHFWGDNIPDWVEVLATECDLTSQNKVALKINKSAAAISQVLRNSYSGTVDNIEKAVRSMLMNSEHECPMYGTILSRDCDINQRRPFSMSGNPVKNRLFKACQHCQFNNHLKEKINDTNTYAITKKDNQS